MEGVSIQREIEIVSEELAKLKKRGAESNKELQDINKNLRLDPTSTELLAQKQAVLSQQLQVAKERSAQLKHEIELLNSEKAKQTYTDEQITNRLKELNTELAKSERAVIGLTGAVEKQAQANTTLSTSSQDAKEKTADFSKSLTEHQSKLRAVSQAMSGLITFHELLGGDKDSAIGKTLEQGRKWVQVATGMASMAKVLATTNKETSNSFMGVASSIGAAVLVGKLAWDFFNQFDGTTRIVVGSLGALTGALVAGAFAWAAFNTAMSWGTAAAGIAAGLAVAAAGVAAAVTQAKTATDSMGIPSIDGSNGSSYPSISTSTPAVPKYTSTVTSSQPQMIVQTLSQRQTADAFYEAGAKLIMEYGVGENKFVGTAEINGRELIRMVFKDILAENRERGNPL